MDPEADNDTNYAVESIKDARLNRQLIDPATKRKGLLQYLVR
jgi:hypothetical protein